MSGYKKLEFIGEDQKFLAGLSWDINERKTVVGEPEPHDLDISCVLLSSNKTVIDFITPSNPKRKDYGLMILHSGDNQSGSADFEDESIVVNFKKIAPDIAYIVFCVSCKKGVAIEKVAKPFCHFSDATTLKSIASIDLKTPSMNDLKKWLNDDFVTGVLRKSSSNDWEFNPVYLNIASLSERDVLNEVGSYL